MTKKYRAAVVGMSGIGGSPLPLAPDWAPLGQPWPHSHVASYSSVPSVELVAACDLKPELLDEFKSNWGGRWPEARTYTSVSEMLEREELDLISVVTPDHRHAQIVIDAAEAGVKGILCEKPIATTLEEADRMVAACEKHGAVMAVNHTRRWYPMWRTAFAQFGKGPLGQVRRIVAHLGGERSMLFRNGTHVIDSVVWFARGKPEWVSGLLDDEHREHPPRYAGEGGRDPALDPGASAMVRFDNGVVAFLNMSKTIKGPLEMEVFGDNGRVHITPSVTEVWSTPPGGWGESRTFLAVPHYVRGDTPAAIMELIDVIEGRGEITSPPSEARKTLEIMLAILQSNGAGGAPVRAPFRDA